MNEFKGFDVSNEYRGDVIRQWVNNKSKVVDDIFGPFKNYQLSALKSWEDHLIELEVPFITTVSNNEYTIWKEQKAEHV